MELTDILSQYLYEEQHEALKVDASYQAARSARNQAAEALTDTLSPEQLRLFHTYMEQENYLDALALRHFFSRCALLLVPQGR